ncbi:MAG: histidine--tRNA ligase [Candidatus Marinimicrobia bacterium]|nr:histidine--tRNA ligase [Candidatus Neomarinimicrobiota bacterium]
MKFRSIKGTYDVLPNISNKWKNVEFFIHQYLNRAGYNEIRTPVFENTDLFKRSVGEDSDVVSKEMYSWVDQGGTNLTLKPEYTASVVRSYIQNNLNSISPISKLYYIGDLFRRERPQKGRYRQFRQFGIEAIGSKYSEQDAEIISIAWNIISELGIQDITLNLNSIGSLETRKIYRQVLIEYLKPHFDQLSESSKNRFNSNPLRILDSKNKSEIEMLKQAPKITEYLSKEDEAHFNEVQQGLGDLNIPFSLDTNLVRGLDYYSRTTFEIVSNKLGAQDALCGGGRYDKLVESLGGKPTPAVGFAAGFERILLAMDDDNEPVEKNIKKIYLIGLGDEVRSTMITILGQIRNAGFYIEFDPLRRSIKSQLRESNKLGASITIILGEKEMEEQCVQIKDLSNGNQQSVPFDSIISYLKSLK